MTENNHVLKTGLAFASGLAMGYVVNLFMSSNVKSKHRRQLLGIKESISPDNFDELTTNLFGKSTKDMKSKVDEILGEFQGQVDSIKNAADSFDGRKYQKLVNDFTARMQKDYDFSTDQIDRLKAFLKSDYQKVLQALRG